MFQDHTSDHRRSASLLFRVIMWNVVYIKKAVLIAKNNQRDLEPEVFFTHVTATGNVYNAETEYNTWEIIKRVTCFKATE